MATKPKLVSYFLVVVDHDRLLKDPADVLAARVYSLDGVSNVTAKALDSEEMKLLDATGRGHHLLSRKD
jgi:hypothetical protein